MMTRIHHYSIKQQFHCLENPLTSTYLPSLSPVTTFPPFSGDVLGLASVLLLTYPLILAKPLHCLLISVPRRTSPILLLHRACVVVFKLLSYGRCMAGPCFFTKSPICPLIGVFRLLLFVSTILDLTLLYYLANCFLSYLFCFVLGVGRQLDLCMYVCMYFQWRHWGLNSRTSCMLSVHFTTELYAPPLLANYFLFILSALYLFPIFLPSLGLF